MKRKASKRKLRRKKLQPQFSFRKLFSRIFVFVGIVLLTLSVLFTIQRYLPGTYNPNDFVIQKSTITEKNTPVAIEIPSINVKLKIVPAKYVNGQFETITDGVSYLSSTPIPGEKGNSILYGHNWTSLLGSLPRVKVGDMIKITYDNGETKNFEINFTTVVDPTQTQVLANTKDSRITIYTCTGFLDSKRFVAVAFPVISPIAANK